MSTLPISRPWVMGGNLPAAHVSPPLDRASGLRWLAGLRVMLALGILAPMATVAAGDGDIVRVIWLIGLIAVAATTSAVALATARHAPAWALYPQVTLDGLVVLALLWSTGGLVSQFTPLLLLPVLASGAIHGRRAALRVACGLVLGLIVVFVCQFDVLAAPAWLGIPFDAMRPSLTGGLFTLAIQASGVMSVAVLIGHLTESLHRKSADLERAHIDLADLTSLSQRVLDSMVGGVVAADAEGQVVLFNRTASAITGLSATQVLGRRLVDVLQLPAGWQVGLSQGLPARFEFRYTRAGGDGLELGATVAPLVSDTGHVAGELLTFQDLTLIKQRERERQRQARLAAVGEMAAGIAHEIRNPLASMSGSIQLLQRELTLGDEQAMLLDIVLRESQRLNQTIKDFLTYAGPQRVTRATVDVRPLLRETVELLTRGGTVGPQHQIEADLPDRPVVHDVDEAQIRQVLWNLATNALKAMPDGGRLCLSVAHDAEASRREPTLVIAVEDNGIGMDADGIERMFQPFQGGFRQGTGLGLSIVHRIVADHGGSVRVSSRPGEGTRVCVRIPWRADSIGAAGAAEA